MYFVKRIIVDDKQCYISSKIVDHCQKTVATALIQLQSTVRSFVKDEWGREAEDKISFCDIKNLGDIKEPSKDCILLYRLESDPFRIYIYRRKTETETLPGKIYGTVAVTTTSFRCNNIFELESYEKSIDGFDANIPPPPAMDDIEKTEYGPTKIKIDKRMTVSPMCDVIKELVKSSMFRARLTITVPTNDTFSPKPDPIVVDV